MLLLRRRKLRLLRLLLLLRGRELLLLLLRRKLLNLRGAPGSLGFAVLPVLANRRSGLKRRRIEVLLLLTTRRGRVQRDRTPGRRTVAGRNSVR